MNIAKSISSRKSSATVSQTPIVATGRATSADSSEKKLGYDLLLELSMSESPAYLLIPASSGLAIEQKPNGIYQDVVDGKQQQQWRVEMDGKKVAFRNVGSSSYLRCMGGNKAAKVTTGKKQFFSLEKSDTPNAVWIKCTEFPNAYLCNSYGAYTKNNLIYVWAHEPYYTQTMLWYIADVETWKAQKQSDPVDSIVAGPAAGKRSSAAFGTRLTDLEQKQERLEAREKDFEAREKKLKEQEEAQKKELDAQERKSKDEEAAWKKDIEAREKKVKEQEEAITKKQQDLDAQSKRQGLSGKNGDSFKQGSGESEKMADELANLRNQLDEANNELEESQRAQTSLQARVDELANKEQQTAKAYEELKAAKSQDGSPGGDIAARRVQPIQRESGAADVGSRNEPPRLRTSEKLRSTRRDRSSPIVMPQGFGYLPRLNS